MSINISKGSSINLSKSSPSLRYLHIGLGWDVNTSNDFEIDCDVSVFMLNDTNKIPADGFFVFYNNLKSQDNSVVHQGDNRTGEGDGDDEVITINLKNVDSSIEQMIFVVTIHESEIRKQNFSMIDNIFLRVYDLDANKELCRYDLSESFPECDSVQIGRIYFYESEWNFEALSQGFDGGLATLLEIYN